MLPPEFTDGGLFQNNPVQIALEESKSLAKTWNLVPTPDVVLSVGTGLPTSYVGTSTQQQPPSNSTEVSSAHKSWYRVLFSVVSFQVKINLDAEKHWRDHIKYVPELRSRMHRINPYLGRDPPEMDDKDCVPELSKTVAHDLQNKRSLRNKVREAACALAASSFYFEVKDVLSERTGVLRLSGSIKCRLSGTGDDVRGLGTFLSGCNSSFLVQSIPQHNKDLEIAAPVQTMVRNGSFNMKAFVVEVPGEEVHTKISLKLPGMSPTGQLYPISGFPRCLFSQDAVLISQQKYGHAPEYVAGAGPSEPSIGRLALE